MAGRILSNSISSAGSKGNCVIIAQETGNNYNIQPFGNVCPAAYCHAQRLKGVVEGLMSSSDACVRALA
eukprot:7584553-Pyramimonas_sp.AAC.1